MIAACEIRPGYLDHPPIPASPACGARSLAALRAFLGSHPAVRSCEVLVQRRICERAVLVATEILGADRDRQGGKKMTITTSITSRDAAGECRGDSQLLHRLFEAQVDRRPDAIVCIWQGTTYSYAMLVPSSGTLPGRADLESLLSRRLPPYMVPSSFVQISSFPLTTNGKLDIAALPAPDMESIDHQEPATDTERFLADVWLRTLGGSVRAGRTDGFLALGGDSIGAARVLAELLERRGIELSFREFFGVPLRMMD
jgi:hypothetical protein